MTNNLGAPADPDGLLVDLHALRAKARHDRNGYWLPLLVFGVAILAAPLAYRPLVLPIGFAGGEVPQDYGPQLRVAGVLWAPFTQYSTNDFFDFGNLMGIAAYWLTLVIIGPLLTLAWYHWRARRVGVAGRTGTYLVYTLLSLIAYSGFYPVLWWMFAHSQWFGGHRSDVALLSIGVLAIGLTLAAVAALPGRRGLPMSLPRKVIVGVGMVMAIAGAAAIGFCATFPPLHTFGPLMIISIGLLALAWSERSWLCTTIAVLFTAAAVLANLYDMEDVFTRFGQSIYRPGQLVVFDNLLLPGAVLVLGGVVGWLVTRRRPA